MTYQEMVDELREEAEEIGPEDHVATLRPGCQDVIFAGGLLRFETDGAVRLYLAPALREVGVRGGAA